MYSAIKRKQILMFVAINPLLPKYFVHIIIFELGFERKPISVNIQKNHKIWRWIHTDDRWNGLMLARNKDNRTFEIHNESMWISCTIVNFHNRIQFPFH